LSCGFCFFPLEYAARRTGAPTVIDAYGDCFLSGSCAIDDNEWNICHNAFWGTVADCGRRGGARIQTEKGRSKVAGSKRRLADILVRGSHKYKPAEGKEIYCDWVCTSELCPTIVANTAKESGAAAQAAADCKHFEAKGHAPSQADFLALPPRRTGLSHRALMRCFTASPRYMPTATTRTSAPCVPAQHGRPRPQAHQGTRSARVLIKYRAAGQADRDAPV